MPISNYGADDEPDRSGVEVLPGVFRADAQFRRVLPGVRPFDGERIWRRAETWYWARQTARRVRLLHLPASDCLSFARAVPQEFVCALSLRAMSIVLACQHRGRGSCAIVDFVPRFRTILGPLLAVLCVTIPALAALFLWIVLVAKAIQGERFTLPVIGSVAENYSRSS